MCGIAGEIRFDGVSPVDGLSSKMAEAIKHRGPDGSGTWSDKHASLAQKRLAIRGLGLQGKQPTISHDKKIISVFNGEIYNFTELSRLLSVEFGFNIKGDCDSELIPAGYRAWGANFFSMLEGMFAIAIWDSQNKVFQLARDAIGIKPLFYHNEKNRLIFGSEIKAVEVGLLQRSTLNYSSFHEFISHGYVGNNRTMLNNINQIPPGSYLTLRENYKKISQYWRPVRSVEKVSKLEAQKKFTTLFSSVCKDHLISDVPLGLMVSGGIDSSLISLMLQDKKLPHYTARFKRPDFDELDKSRIISKMVGSECIELYCDDGIDLEEDLTKVINHSDGHLADPSSLAFYRLCKQMSKNCKVALSGDGGDEFFAGYDTYLATILSSKLNKIVPQNLATKISKSFFFSKVGLEKKYPKLQILGRFFEGVGEGSLAHAEWRRFIPSWSYEQIYGKEMKQFCLVDPLEEYKKYISESSNTLDGSLEADQSYYLPSDLLFKVDTMSMAHGLEVRVPFLDKRVMNFANSLPQEYLVGHFINKRKDFLRKSLAQFNVSSKILKQSKSGFEVPTTSLLKSELKDFCVDLFEGNADLFAPYLKPDAIKKIWLEHKEEEQDYGYFLWALITFAVWWGKFYKWRPVL